MANQQKRNTAIKVRISEIVSGSYIKSDNESSYIDSGGKKLYRVNLLATAVTKNSSGAYANLIIDDGSGKVSLRSFDNQQMFDEFSAGDIVIIIGRPREFGSERYIVPEIIKKVNDSAWIQVRARELINVQNGGSINGKADSPYDKISKLVGDCDNGEGADVDEIISKSNLDNADALITGMIKEGIVYEAKSGRIKLV